MAINRLENLKGRHLGKRAVLVGSGPSLNQMDLGFLREEIVIGLNKLFLGFQKFCFYPKYYVVVNTKVITQSAEALKRLTCVSFIAKHSEALVPESGLVYHIDTIKPYARFCHDISRGVHEGWTVTYAAMQIAFYLGFSELVLIGVDHRYQFTGRPNEPQRLEGPDPNHFCPDYFGGGQDWDNPDLRRSEESYQLARQEFERDGRRIVDATVGGACPVFEKADHKKLFGLS